MALGTEVPGTDNRPGVRGIRQQSAPTWNDCRRALASPRGLSARINDAHQLRASTKCRGRALPASTMDRNFSLVVKLHLPYTRAHHIHASMGSMEPSPSDTLPASDTLAAARLYISTY